MTDTHNYSSIILQNYFLMHRMSMVLEIKENVCHQIYKQVFLCVTGSVDLSFL